MKVTSTIFMTLALLLGAFIAPAQELVEKYRGIQVNGTIRDMEDYGDNLYVGGSFSKAGLMGANATITDPTTGKVLSTTATPNSSVLASIPDGSGGYYIAGGFTAVGNDDRSYLAHIDSDGSLSDWGQYLSFNDNIHALHKAGNTLYVGGEFTSASKKSYSSQLFKAGNTSAELAEDFPTVSGGSIEEIIPDGNGGYYIGGSFLQVGGLTRNGFAQINADGEVTDFVLDFNGTVFAMEIADDNMPFRENSIVLAGSFTEVNGVSRGRICQVEIDSKELTEWNPDINGVVYDIEYNRSMVYVGGNFSAIVVTTATQTFNFDRNNIAVISFNGSPQGWAPEASGAVYSLELDLFDPNTSADDRIYVGGSFTSIGGQSRSRIAELDAAFNLTTNQATDWNPGANGTVYDIVLSNDGNTLFAGGSFTTIAGVSRSRVAELNISDATATSWNPTVSSTVNTIALSNDDNEIYVGGVNFTQVNGFGRENLAKIGSDGSLLPWDIEVNNGVNVIHITSDGDNVLVGGDFSTITSPQKGLAAVDITTGELLDFNPGVSGTVYDLTSSSTQLYVAGDITSVGVEVRNNLAAFDLSDLSLNAWDPDVTGGAIKSMALSPDENTVYVGGNFTSVGTDTRYWLAGINASDGLATAWVPNSFGGDVTGNGVEVILLNAAGDALYVGGKFSEISNDLHDNLVRYDALSGTFSTRPNGNWTPDPSNTVNTLALSLDENSLYVGGVFNTIVGQTRNDVAQIQATGSNESLTSWNPDPSGAVYTIALTENGSSGISSLMIGGSYTGLGGEARSNLAAFDLNTGQLLDTWTPTTNGEVYSMDIDFSDIYIGGSFTQVNGTTRNRVAKLNRSDGALNTSFDANANSTVFVVEEIDDFLYVGGTFTSIDGEVGQKYLARVSLSSGNALTSIYVPNGAVRAIQKVATNTSYPNDVDQLFIGGDFTQIDVRSNGTTIANRSFFAKVSNSSFYPDNGNDPGWDRSDGLFNSRVNVIARPSGTVIYVGGAFTTFAGEPFEGGGSLRWWEASESSAWDIQGEVYALTNFPNPYFVGGRLSRIDGSLTPNLAYISNQGTRLTNWNSGITGSSGRVYDIIVDETEGVVFAAGSFTSAGGQPASGFAALTLKVPNKIKIDPLAEKIYGDDPFTLPETTDVGLTITYTSSDPEIASINGNEVSIHKAGTVTITANQAGLSGVSLQADYAAAEEVTRTLTINPKELMVESVVAADKIYDKETSASLSGAVLMGALEGDEVILENDETGTFAQSAVGQDILVSTAMTITGADAANYELIQPDYITADITLKELTVLNAAVEDKVYDGAATTTVSGATLSGLFGGDDVILEDATAGTFEQNTVGSGLAVTTEMTLSGADAFKYSLTQPDYLTAAITPRSLTIGGAFTISDKTYDGNLSATLAENNLTLPEKVGDDDVYLAGLEFQFSDPNVSSVIEVTIREAVIMGTMTDNYSFSMDGSPTTTAAITQRPLIIEADSKTKVYGEADPELIFTVTEGSLVEGEAFTGELERQAGEDVHSHAIGRGTLKAGDNFNYYVTFHYDYLSITKATLTVKADDKSITYGDEEPVYTYSLEGFQFEEDASVIDILPGEVAPTLAVGDVSTYTLQTEEIASDNNYTFEYVDGELTVAKATLTATVDNKSKVYGADNPELTFQYSGFVNDETLAVIDEDPILNTDATVLSGAGEYEISITGGTDNNYEIALETGNLTIEKASLAFTAEDKSRAYGEENPEFTFTVEGFVNGDDVNDLDVLPTGTTEALVTTPVGGAEINFSGGEDDNYTYGFSAGSLTINKAVLAATADARTKVYGAENPELTVSYEGFVNGEGPEDITEPVPTTNATAASPVGTYDISLSEGISSNYAITLENSTLEVTPATLTVTAENKTKVYGEENPELTHTYSGFQVEDDATVVLTDPEISTAVDAQTGVGTYAITTSGGEAANYEFAHVEGALEVTKATLTATAGDQSRLYGEENPEFTVAYTGFVNEDDLTAITTVPTGTTEAGVTTGVGEYDITYSGAAAENYAFEYVTGTLTIQPAPLTITADDATRVYGEENPGFTLSYSGFVNDETSEVVEPPVAGTEATPSSPVGTYDIVLADGSAANYEITLVSGSLEVTAATLTATAEDQTKVYGSGNPELTLAYSGFANDDDESVVTSEPEFVTDADATSDVGAYDILLDGAQADNYVFEYVSGTLTITQATLTATAEDQTRSYGAEAPDFTLTYDGFLNDDDENAIETPPSGTTDAVVTSGVGEYAITLSGGVSKNYAFEYQEGTLTITKAALTARADDVSKTYGDSNPEFTISYEGFVNEDTEADITIPTAGTEASEASAVGVYEITLAGGESDNYAISLEGGTLTVSNAELTVSVNDQEKTYLDENPEFTYEISGFVNQEDASVVTTAPTLATDATTESDAGTYAINASGAGAPNYSFTYVPGTLTINKAGQDITIVPIGQKDISDDPFEVEASASSGLDPEYAVEGPATIAGNLITLEGTAGTVVVTVSQPGNHNYEAAAPQTESFTVIDGSKAVQQISFANIEDQTYGAAPISLEASSDLGLELTYSVSGPASLEGNVLTITGVGTVTVTASQVGNETTNPAEASQTFTVMKATLMATADDKEMVYGSDLPTLTYTLDGFVNDETDEVLQTLPTATTNAASDSDVGVYEIQVSGGEADNYDFSYASAELAITRANQEITVAEIADKIITDAPFEVEASTTSGLNLSYDVSGPASMSSNVVTLDGNTGTVLIEVSQAGNHNYEAARSVSVSFTVSNPNKTDQAITFEPIGDQQYGDQLDLGATTDSGLEVAYTITSGPATVSGATLTVTGIGTISVLATQEGTDQFNPAQSVSQSFTADKADLTISADDVSRTYGEANPDLDISYAGFVNDDNESVMDEVPTASTDATAESDAGTYTIEVSGGASELYELGYVPGTLTVEKAEATITITDLEQRADGSPRAPVVTTDPGGLNFVMTFDGSSETPAEPGSYELVVTIDEINYQGTATDIFRLTQVLGTTQPVTVNLYPNPVTADFRVDGADELEVYLYDMKGTLHLRAKTNENINVGQLPEGTYLIRVMNGAALFTDHKLIKR